MTLVVTIWKPFTLIHVTTPTFPGYCSRFPRHELTSIIFQQRHQSRLEAIWTSKSKGIRPGNVNVKSSTRLTFMRKKSKVLPRRKNLARTAKGDLKVAKSSISRVSCPWLGCFLKIACLISFRMKCIPFNWYWFCESESCLSNMEAACSALNVSSAEREETAKAEPHRSWTCRLLPLSRLTRANSLSLTLSKYCTTTGIGKLSHKMLYIAVQWIMNEVKMPPWQSFLRTPQIATLFFWQGKNDLHQNKKLLKQPFCGLKGFWSDVKAAVFKWNAEQSFTGKRECDLVATNTADFSLNSGSLLKKSLHKIFRRGLLWCKWSRAFHYFRSIPAFKLVACASKLVFFRVDDGWLWLLWIEETHESYQPKERIFRRRPRRRAICWQDQLSRASIVKKLLFC